MKSKFKALVSPNYQKEEFERTIIMIGAGRGNRTPTMLPSPDFESGASTNSAIPAERAIMRHRSCPGQPSGLGARASDDSCEALDEAPV